MRHFMSKQSVTRATVCGTSMWRAAVGMLLASGLLAAGSAQEIVANSSVRYLGARSSLMQVPVTRGSAAVTALDHQGNLVVADTGRGLVSRVPLQGGAVSTLGSGISGISAIAVDVQGDVYVASTNQVLELPAGGGVKTIATGLNHPASLAIGVQETVVVADTGNNRVLSIAPGGGVTVLSNSIPAPTAVFQSANGDLYVGGRGRLTLIAATSQVFPLGQGWSQPTAILQTATRDLFVVDHGGTTLTKFSYATLQQQVLIASSDSLKPGAIAGDSTGNLYVFDTAATQLVKFDPSFSFGPVPVGTQSSGFTLTFGFQSPMTLGSILELTQGTVDGQLAGIGGSCVAAHAYQPGDTCTVTIAVTPKQAGAWNGDVTLVDDAGNDLLDTEVFAQGVAPVQTLLPGVATTYFRDPYVYESELLPSSLAVDAANNLYIGDDGNRRVLRVAPDGSSTIVLAGNEANNSGLGTPLALALDGKGDLVIADSSYAYGVGPTLPTPGAAPGNVYLAIPYGQWGPNQQYVAYMTGMVVQPNGGFIFSDSSNNRVVAVDPDGYGVEILNTSNLIGSEKLPINYPFSLAWQADGSLLVADFGNGRIIRRTRDGVTSDVVAPGAAIAGAPLVQPMGLAVDPAGNIYISDAGNNRVVAISPQGRSWVVADASTVVDGSVTMPISDPQTLAMNSQGDLYIADMGNERVVKLTRSTEDLRFSQTSPGSQSAPVSTTVENTGNSPLVLQSVGTAGSSVFSLLPASTCHAQTTLAVDSSCTLSVVYAPATDGNDQGQLDIVSNTQAGAAVSTQIPLYGTTHPLVDHFRLLNLPTAAAAGSPFSYTLRAEDPRGNAVAGYRGTVQIVWNAVTAQAVQYTFTGADAGAHIVTNTVLTTAGVNTLTIGDVQNPVLTVTAQLLLSAGTPAVLTLVSGGGQSAPLEQAFAQPVVIQVADAFGNLAAGVQVTLTSPATGAGAMDGNGNSVQSAMTDGTGQASVSLLANSTAGSYTVAASAPGATPVSVPLTNTAIGFTMKATPTTTSFNAAGQASVLLSILPVPGFTGTITFSCREGNGASCNFSNSSVQVQANASTANTAAAGTTIPIQVTISNASDVAAVAGSGGKWLPQGAAAAIAMSVLAGCFGLGRIRRYRNALGVLMMCLLLVSSSVMMTGCVGNAILRPTGPVLQPSPISMTVVGQTTIPGLAQPFQQSVTIKVMPFVSPVSGGSASSGGSGGSGNPPSPCGLRGSNGIRCVKSE